MDTELMLDVGQANELKLAFRRAGWSNAEIKKLCGGNLLTHLLPIVREYGETAMTVIQHTIDCDAVPFTPSGWRIEEGDQLAGRVRGQFAFDPTKVKLHLSPNQLGEKCIIKGENLKKELASEPVLPANVLDFLLANPRLIPDDWKGKYVFFWGTIYRGSSGRPYVRCLYFLGGRWDSSFDWLVSDWLGGNPAALRASI